MAEQYPPDATLNALDGTTDDATGLPYQTIGQSPHYTHRFKLYNFIARVLAAAANPMRVYKDGDLTFGVRAGKYLNGDSAVNYAGATAQSLTNNQTNYIYLTAAGTLTVNTTGFPTPSTTPHVPLATILTAAGAYDCDDITDYRSRTLFSVQSGMSGALMAEAAAFFAATDITPAEAEKLTDGSNCDAKHVHGAAGLESTLDLTGKTISVATPTTANHAANKSYVDGIAAGLKAKASVVAATTANITLSNEQTIDGISVVADDRVLVKNQTATEENGIYVASASAWSRATDADAWDELVSATAMVEKGTANADRQFVCTVDSGGTLDTTAVTFILFYNATGQTMDTIPDGSSYKKATADEKNALAGTSGTPSGSNKFLTDNDTRNSDERTPTDSSTTAAKLAAAIQDLLPNVNLAGTDDADGTGTMAIQVRDAADNNLAQRFLLRVWIADAEYSEPDAQTDFSILTGEQMRQLEADADYEVITDASGYVNMNIDTATNKTVYVMAELDGRIYTGSVAITGNP